MVYLLNCLLNVLMVFINNWKTCRVKYSCHRRTPYIKYTNKLIIRCWALLDSSKHRQQWEHENKKMCKEELLQPKDHEKREMG